MIFPRDSCIRIPIKLKHEKWVAEILKKLTRKSRSFIDKELVEIKTYYDVSSSSILLPRFYPIESYGYSSKCCLEEGDDIDIISSVKPRDNKQENAISWMINNDRGVLCMKPGDGKTVVSIKAICDIGKRALIFVHTTPLLEQWADRISEHSNLLRDQIGIFSTSNYQNTLNKPIVITTVQSYLSFIKSNIEANSILSKAGFGIAIWDECHTSVSAEQFSKSSLNTYSKKVFGLSATPERLDGNSDIIDYHLSKVYHPVGESKILDCKIVFLQFDFELLPKYKYRIYQLYLENGNPNKGLFNKSIYLSLLSKSQKFTTIIKQICNQCSEKDRQTLLLSERINLIGESSKHIPSHKFGNFTGGGTKDRECILNKQIIGSTYQKGRDGLDVPRLDTIVFLTPPSNIEQAVGRIQRQYQDKQQPVVIDIIDTGCEDAINRSKYRRKFYNSKSWSIEDKKI